MDHYTLIRWYARINQAAREMVGMEPRTHHPDDAEMFAPENRVVVEWLATLDHAPSMDEYRAFEPMRTSGEIIITTRLR